MQTNICVCMHMCHYSQMVCTYICMYVFMYVCMFLLNHTSQTKRSGTFTRSIQSRQTLQSYTTHIHTQTNTRATFRDAFSRKRRSRHIFKKTHSRHIISTRTRSGRIFKNIKFKTHHLNKTHKIKTNFLIRSKQIFLL